MEDHGGATSDAVQRIGQDIEELKTNPPEWVDRLPKMDDQYNWRFIVIGPSSSPFCGGKFCILVVFPKDYPQKPPDVIFGTKIFHPNIAEDGKASLPVLHDWMPKFTIKKVFVHLVYCLAFPSLDYIVNRQAGPKFRFNPSTYKTVAAEWTRKYAV